MDGAARFGGPIIFDLAPGLTEISVIDRMRAASILTLMNRNQPKPESPKPCPICLVAMQATRDTNGVTHRCAHCGVVVTIAYAKAAAERPRR